MDFWSKKNSNSKFIFQISIIVTIFHLIFSIFLAPAALNKSRQLLSNENLISILPTFKIQKFSDSFKDLTFIIDNKYENKISNIFLHDESDNLKNIVTNEDGNTSTTIIAKNGIVEAKQLILFDGIIISTKDNIENDIVTFEQIKVNLSALTNTTIKQPKIQETSTLKLLGCANNNFFNDRNCEGNFKKETLPTLNRRIILPLFIPLITLISSLLLIKNKKNIWYNKISIFGYAFFILLYAELIIRFTGKNFLIASIFILSPFILSLITYFFIRLQFLKETKIYA